VKPVDPAALAAVLRDLPRREAPFKGPRKVTAERQAPQALPGGSASAGPGA